MLTDAAVGQVMRNWPHVFSVLSLLSELMSVARPVPTDEGEPI